MGAGDILIRVSPGTVRWVNPQLTAWASKHNTYVRRISRRRAHAAINLLRTLGSEPKHLHSPCALRSILGCWLPLRSATAWVCVDFNFEGDPPPLVNYCSAAPPSMEWALVRDPRLIRMAWIRARVEVDSLLLFMYGNSNLSNVLLLAMLEQA